MDLEMEIKEHYFEVCYNVHVHVGELNAPTCGYRVVKDSIFATQCTCAVQQLRQDEHSCSWRIGDHNSENYMRLVMQVIDVIEALFTDIFNGIEDTCTAELQAVQDQFPFEPFVMKPMRFTFAEAVKVWSHEGRQ